VPNANSIEGAIHYVQEIKHFRPVQPLNWGCIKTNQLRLSGGELLAGIRDRRRPDVATARPERSRLGPSDCGPGSPNLRILDLRMTRARWYRALELVRQRPVLARIPVLIVSGFLDEEPVPHHGLNIVGHLPKPQSLEELVYAVRAGLARRPPP